MTVEHSRRILVSTPRTNDSILLITHDETTTAADASTNATTSSLRGPSSSTSEPATPNQSLSLAQAAAQHGVDPIYLELLQVAQQRSHQDFQSSHKRGEIGIVIGPTDGDFLKHSLRALRSARRIRNVLQNNSLGIRLAFMTTPAHVQLLDKQCSADPIHRKYVHACQLWANNTLFDDVILTQDDYQWNDNHTRPDFTASRFWLKSLGSYRHAPYKLSLFLDSDAFVCPGFERIFAMGRPKEQKYWQLRHQGITDFAAGIDQYAFGTGSNIHLVPGDPAILKDYFTFPERNTGTLLFHFHRELTHVFAHFVPLVAEYMWTHKATTEKPILNDQCPFRVALYLFQRLHPDFVDQTIAQHTSCRAYPGWNASGTHAEHSRMIPSLLDGSMCNECYCTPCLVAHFSLNLPIPIHGKMGWEDDFVLGPPYIMPEQ
jgi:hypothetical protein